MKHVSALLAATALALVATATLTAQPATAPARKSPHETISAVIGERRTGNRVTIVYGRPHTADPKTGAPRKIWGGLVPWEKPDRLGADEATLLLTQKPLVFGSVTIPAGAYTLYQIPSENGVSKLAFSSTLGKWGVPVDADHDVARIDLQKAALDQPVDQLTIRVENSPATGGGLLTIEWEKTSFSAPFTVAK